MYLLCSPQTFPWNQKQGTFLVAHHPPGEGSKWCLQSGSSPELHFSFENFQKGPNSYSNILNFSLCFSQRQMGLGHTHLVNYPPTPGPMRAHEWSRLWGAPGRNASVWGLPVLPVLAAPPLAVTQAFSLLYLLSLCDRCSSCHKMKMYHV